MNLAKINLAESITEHHKDLYQWFLLHQEALLCDELILAGEAWQHFESGLRLHIALENEHLFSDNYSVLELDKLTWGVHVYQKEHNKIEDLLDKLSDMLLMFKKITGRKKRLALLGLLEKQISFRQVLEHHEEREERDALLAIKQIESRRALSFMASLNKWRQNSQASRDKLKAHFSD